MPRTMRCACGAVIPLDRDQIGRRVRCPSCRTVILAAYEDEEEGYDLDPEDRDEEPAPRSRKRPRPKRPAKDPNRPRTEGPLGRLAVYLRQPVWSFCLMIVTAFMLACLVMGMWWTFGPSDKPKEMPLSQLIAQGAEDRLYIDLTEFVPAKVVYYRAVAGPSMMPSGKRPVGKWTDAYVPLFPRTNKAGSGPQAGQAFDNGPEPDAVVVLLHTTRVQDEEELERLATRSQLRGVAHQRSKPLGGLLADKIKQQHPRTDFSRIIVFEKEGKPDAPTGGVVWMLIGLLGFLGCAFFLYVFFKR